MNDLSDSTVEKTLQDNLELYISEYGLRVKLERQPLDDQDGWRYWNAVITDTYQNPERSYRLLCRINQAEDCEFCNHADDFYPVSNDLWRWLYITAKMEYEYEIKHLREETINKLILPLAKALYWEKTRRDDWDDLPDWALESWMTQARRIVVKQ